MAFDDDEPLLSTNQLVNKRWSITTDILGDTGSNSIYAKAVEEIQKIMPYLEDRVARMPDVDITYPTYNVAINTDIESERPDPPTDAELTIANVNYPAMRRSLLDVYMPEILSLPESSDIPNMENLQLTWNEQSYEETLMTALSSSIEDWIENGGTGLGSDALDALWDNHLERLQDQHENEVDVVLNLFSSLGWNQPPGAAAGMVARVGRGHTRDLNQRNNEMTIEEARLTQQNTQFAHTVGVNWQQILIAKHNAVQDRAYALAKDLVTVPLQIFAMRVELYKARVAATQSSADAAKTIVEARSSMNRDTTAIYEADISAYRTRVEAEIKMVMAVAEKYAALMRGHESEARVAALKVDAELKKYEALIEQAKNESTITLEEARLLLANWLSVTQLGLGAQTEVTKLVAQIVASVVGSISASASMGYSFSRTDHTSRTDPENQEHTTYSHVYQET